MSKSVISRWYCGRKFAMRGNDFALRMRLGRMVLEKKPDEGYDPGHILGREILLDGNPVLAANQVGPFRNGSAYPVLTTSGKPIALIITGPMGTGGSTFINKLIASNVFGNPFSEATVEAATVDEGAESATNGPDVPDQVDSVNG